MNISISEVLVVLLVALLVIKPEQLPDVALILGRFAKSIKRLFTRMKDEMNDLIDPVEKIVAGETVLEESAIKKPKLEHTNQEANTP